MKKTLAIVLALAMVFVMGFSAFAEGEDLLHNGRFSIESDSYSIVAKIVDDERE